MIILFDGLDNTGKTTQIEKLQTYFAKQGLITNVWKYSKVSGLTKSECIAYSKTLYMDMFEKLSEHACNIFSKEVLILDRCHFSEFVYSPLYRGYSGKYVLELEEKYNYYFALYGEDIKYPNYFSNKLYSFIFYDSPYSVIKRDDGLSHSINIDNKLKEIKLFNNINKLSYLNPIGININNLTINDVHERIVSYF